TLTTDLTTALNTAKGARDQAATDADTAITAAAGVKENPTVKQAITDLQTTLDNADKGTQTTADIQKAIDKLTAATTDAANATAEATSPYSLEPAVAAAKAALTTAIGNGTDTKTIADNAAALTVATAKAK